jgi:hypothetical protein
VAYLTYSMDVRRSLKRLKAPAKKWAKSLIGVRDPYKLFGQTFRFFALILWAGLKVCFYSIRKLVNR